MLSQRNMFYLGVVVIYLGLMYHNQKDLNMCIGLSVIALAIIQFGGQCVNATFAKEKYSNFLADYQKEEKMGLYDGVVLKGAQDSWRLMKDQPMHNPEDVYTLFGTPTSLEDTKSVYDPQGSNYPSVDGTPEGGKSLFAFAFNKSSPECCPSTYSTDTGCVCTTSQQRKFINQRGGNRKGTVTDF